MSERDEPATQASYAQRWTRDAAISFAIHVAEESRAIGLGGSMVEIVEAILTSDVERARFLKRLSKRRPQRVVAQITAIVASKAATVALTGSAHKRAKDLLRTHRNGCGKVLFARDPGWRAYTLLMTRRAVDFGSEARVPPWSGEWLDEPGECSLTLRKPPTVDYVRRWNLAKLGGDLPQHSVVCLTRASRAVSAWHKANGADAPLPIGTLRSLVHTDTLPCAKRKLDDHYYLIALGRWISITELMRLFAIPTTSPLGKALVDNKLPLSTEARAMAIGDAVHVDCAKWALRLALEKTRLPARVRYRSDCSGIDVFAVALDAHFGANGWEYVGASEKRPKRAAFLAAAYGCRGLTPASVDGDARFVNPHTDSTVADLWFWSPPCIGFSGENNDRTALATQSTVTKEDLARTLHRFAQQDKAQRPKVMIVENVDEVEALLAIDDALLSELPQMYVWESFALNANQAVPMSRRRRWWVGILRE